MKIKFIKEYCTCFRDEENMINTETFKPDDTVSTSMEVDRYFTEELARWLIDNGFAEEVKESGWWKPKKNEAYYYESGVVTYRVWTDDESDENRFRIGNCFKTREAIEKWHDYLKANAIVRQDDGVLTPEQINELIRNEDLAYYVGYMGNRGNEEVLAGCTMSFDECWMPVGAILFDTEEHAQASLDNHQDEWKIISNYDWSKE